MITFAKLDYCNKLCGLYGAEMSMPPPPASGDYIFSGLWIYPTIPCSLFIITLKYISDYVETTLNLRN